MSIFKDDILTGKVAFITGGGSGIGKGITQTFMAHGADAVIVSRTQETLDATAAELEAATGRRCLAIAADVRDEAAVYAAVDAAMAEFGRIDVVVNGAAGNFLAPAARLKPKGFRTVMEIDTLGTYHVCRAAFDRALRDNGGHIVNLTATLHYTGVPLQIHAGAAKAAIDAMTRHLAMEWGCLGIKVNSIAPGPIDDTEGITRLVPAALRDKLTASIPGGRFGTVQDIADCALFLVSGAADYITGAVIVVDGGSWMAGMGNFFAMAEG